MSYFVGILSGVSPQTGIMTTLITPEHIDDIHFTDPHLRSRIVRCLGAGLTPLDFLNLPEAILQRDEEADLARPRKDMLLILFDNEILHKNTAQRIGLELTEKYALPVWKYYKPGDKKPFKALEAKKKWLKNKIRSSDLEEARSKAWASASSCTSWPTDYTIDNNAARCAAEATARCAIEEPNTRALAEATARGVAWRSIDNDRKKYKTEAWQKAWEDIWEKIFLVTKTHLENSADGY